MEYQLVFIRILANSIWYWIWNNLIIFFFLFKFVYGFFSHSYNHLQFPSRTMKCKINVKNKNGNKLHPWNPWNMKFSINRKNSKRANCNFKFILLYIWWESQLHIVFIYGLENGLHFYVCIFLFLFFFITIRNIKNVEDS